MLLLHEHSGRLYEVACTEFIHDPRAVDFDGAVRDVEYPCRFLTRIAVPDEVGDFFFSC